MQIDKEIDTLFRAFCELRPGETFKSASQRAVDATRRTTGLSEEEIRAAVHREFRKNLPDTIQYLEDLKTRLGERT